jgi:hypothetical protein
MAMRLMLVISDFHLDTFKLPNLQPSSLTSSMCHFTALAKIYLARSAKVVSLWYEIILAEHDQSYVLTQPTTHPL